MKPPLRLLQGGAESSDEKSAATLLHALPSQSPDDVAVERVWKKLAQPTPRTLPWMWMTIGTLAAVTLVMLLRTPSLPESVHPETVLRAGSISLLRIPGVAAMLVRDGDVVPTPTAQGIRLILTAGSVTARVSKRPPDAPFVIQADAVSVRVVGTLFTVELHGGVSVREGTVEVTDGSGMKSLVTAGHHWSPEGADTTPDRVVDLLEATLAGRTAEQLRAQFETLDAVAVVPSPTPLLIAPKELPKPVPVKTAVARPALPEPSAYDRAVELETGGDFAGAADALEIAVNKEPERSELLVKLGRLAMNQLDDPQRALGAFQRYRRQFPKGPLMEVVDFSVLQIQLGQGDPEATLKELGRYIDTHPTSERVDDLRLRRGQLLSEQNDWGSALADYRSVQGAAQLDEATFLIAVCQQHIGEKEGALNTLRAYLKRFPNGRHVAEARQGLGAP